MKNRTKRIDSSKTPLTDALTERVLIVLDKTTAAGVPISHIGEMLNVDFFRLYHMRRGCKQGYEVLRNCEANLDKAEAFAASVEAAAVS